VSAARSGWRTGGGFYDWPSDGPRTPWAGLGALFPLATRQSERKDIQFRLLAAEAREALRCLEEGVVASADDADAASVLGLGFSPARGGVLRWAEDFGFGPLVEALDGLSRAHGDRFSPSPWLRALAARAEGLSPYRGKDAPA
jgi:3-hydroxyacyl-CoA dehydrogenase